MLFSIFPPRGLLEGVHLKCTLQTLQLESVPRRKEVGIVDSLIQASDYYKFEHCNRMKMGYLDERLNFASLRQLLRTHTLRHLQWVTFNTRNQGVRVWSLLRALIKLFDYDDLFSGMTALENDGDLCDT